MGYRRIDISSIFLWQGALIASVGSLLGFAFSRGLTWASQSPFFTFVVCSIRITFWLFGDWRHYLGNATAVIAVFIASYVPSSVAAHLQPVDTLRDRVYERRSFFSCRDLERYLGKEEGRVHALRGVFSLDVEAGSLVRSSRTVGLRTKARCSHLGLLDQPDAARS